MNNEIDKSANSVSTTPKQEGSGNCQMCQTCEKLNQQSYPKVKNNADRSCHLCMNTLFSRLDPWLFFRRLDFDDFVEFADSRGYHIPKTEFDEHVAHHLRIVD